MDDVDNPTNLDVLRKLHMLLYSLRVPLVNKYDHGHDDDDQTVTIGVSRAKETKSCVVQIHSQVLADVSHEAIMFT